MSHKIELEQKYIDQYLDGECVNDICKNSGLSTTTINNKLKSLGIHEKGGRKPFRSVLVEDNGAYDAQLSQQWISMPLCN